MQMTIKLPTTLAGWVGLGAAVSALVGSFVTGGLWVSDYIRTVAEQVYEEREERAARLGNLNYLLKDCRDRIMLEPDRERLRDQIRTTAAQMGVEVNLENCAPV